MPYTRGRPKFGIKQYSRYKKQARVRPAVVQVQEQHHTKPDTRVVVKKASSADPMLLPL